MWKISFQIWLNLIIHFRNHSASKWQNATLHHSHKFELSHWCILIPAQSTQHRARLSKRCDSICEMTAALFILTNSHHRCRHRDATAADNKTQSWNHLEACKHLPALPVVPLSRQGSCFTGRIPQQEENTPDMKAGHSSIILTRINGCRCPEEPTITNADGGQLIHHLPFLNPFTIKETTLHLLHLQGLYLINLFLFNTDILSND